jgi:hypothetical protein
MRLGEKLDWGIELVGLTPRCEGQPIVTVPRGDGVWIKGKAREALRDDCSLGLLVFFTLLLHLF